MLIFIEPGYMKAIKNKKIIVVILILMGYMAFLGACKTSRPERCGCGLSEMR